MEETDKQKKEVEDFFRGAFCAESAEVMGSERLSQYIISAIVKIKTGDKRLTKYRFK